MHFFVIVNSCARNKVYLLRGRFQQQEMAELPRDRMSEEAPFIFCGDDMYGPFVVKNSLKEMKCDVALYTCLSSRAIQNEVTFSLDTDPFILCLRRFIGRRGNVRLIIRAKSRANYFWKTGGHPKLEAPK